VRDHLFYFGAFDPQWRGSPSSRPQIPLASLAVSTADRRVITTRPKALAGHAEHRFRRVVTSETPHREHRPRSGPNSLLNTTTSGFSALDRTADTTRRDAYSGVFHVGTAVGRFREPRADRIVEIPSVNDPQVIERTVVPMCGPAASAFSSGNRAQLAGRREGHVGPRRRGDSIRSRLWIQVRPPRLRSDQPATGPTLPHALRRSDGDWRADQISCRIQLLAECFRVVRANLNAARDTSQRYWAGFVETRADSGTT